jgi:xanthine dehydrogenase YagS FAD-binding subunit
MNPFAFHRASNLSTPLRILQSESSAKVLGGGTNLVDLMQESVERPRVLVSIQVPEMLRIESLPGGGVRIGGSVRNSDLANHPLIREHYPLLAKAILSGASPQIRNVATTAGNLMQRTRCYYFMDTGFSACNKRMPGSGCAALEGENRIHALFGASDQCIAVHPSDMCVALTALDAIVRLQAHGTARELSIRDFHRLPGRTPEVDTNLQPGEMIVSVDLPKSTFGNCYEYIKVRDRQSFAFSLVSCAAALEIRAGSIENSAVVLGGVAHKPWKCVEVETHLARKSPSKALFDEAASLAVRAAVPQRHNAFKISLAKSAVSRALCAAAGIP